MNIVPDNHQIVAGLDQGQTLLYPTATLWGLGAKASIASTLDKIDALKQRPDGKSYITLVDHVDRLHQFVHTIPDGVLEIALSAQPTTVIIGNVKPTYQHLCKDGRMALRITRSAPCLEIIRELDDGLVSTSANISGQPSPINFDDIADSIKENVDMVFPPQKAGRLTGTASRIALFDANGDIKWLR